MLKSTLLEEDKNLQNHLINVINGEMRNKVLFLLIDRMNSIFDIRNLVAIIHNSLRTKLYLSLPNF